MFPTLWRNAAPSVWDDIFTVRHDFDRLLDRFAGGNTSETLSAWAPVVDVHENTNEITITAELPGVDPDDVHVTVQNGVLTVSGEKNDERKEGSPDSNSYVIERRYGRFERSFALPRTVAPDKVNAEFNNGVLTLRLPKSEESKPRRIEVQGGDSTQKQIRTEKNPSARSNS
jgi:HSP20 family protein